MDPCEQTLNWLFRSLRSTVDCPVEPTLELRACGLHVQVSPIGHNARQGKRMSRKSGERSLASRLVRHEPMVAIATLSAAGSHTGAKA